MLVHVIKPSGVRFEASFSDKTPDEVILRQLAEARAVFGRTGHQRRLNPETGVNELWDDPAAPHALDDPNTVVAVVRPVDSGVVEVRRLKGPPTPGQPGAEPPPGGWPAVAPPINPVETGE